MAMQKSTTTSPMAKPQPSSKTQGKLSEQEINQMDWYMTEDDFKKIRKMRKELGIE